MPTPGFIDPYDNRIGGGQLPAGISGSANRAYTWSPQGGQTSFGLLNRYTAGGSPMIKQAESKAAQQAASRGLLNSSIAAGAGRAAAIDAAGQFATTDSNQQTAAMLKNVDVLNANEAARAASEMQSTMTGVISEANTAAANAERESRLQLQRENLAFSGEQQQLDRIHGTDMSRMGYSQQLGLGEQGYGFQRGLNDQTYGHDIGRQTNASNLDYRNQSSLGAQQFGYERQLNQDAYQNNMALQFMQGWYGDDPEFRDPATLQQTMSYFSSPDYFRRSSYFGG